MQPIETLEFFKLSLSMFENKIKFLWGCGSRRQYVNISISKNKGPPLLVQKVDWRPFRNYHYFLLSQQMFENKNRICVWGCGALPLCLLS